MPKHENNALQKKFYNQFEKGTFSVECVPCMGYIWPVKQVKSANRGRWGTVDTLHFQPLLIDFKSKQAQHLSHNKATLYNTISCQNMQTTPFRKNFTINLNRVLFCRVRSMRGVHLAGQKSLVACIAQCSCDIPCTVSNCWLPLHFFHIVITDYHCMAK